LLKKIDDGNSACIRHVRSIGRASENWTLKRRCPTRIAGMRFDELHFDEVLKSYTVKSSTA